MSDSSKKGQSDFDKPRRNDKPEGASEQSGGSFQSDLEDDRNWADPEAIEATDPVSPTAASALIAPHVNAQKAPVSLVETAFLASTASILWLVSYYLSVSPWTRILFPTPIALVYLRWGQRAAWMATVVTSLLLSVLMGPYLSLLFLIPYGFLGMQLGAMWRRQVPWSASIGLGAIVTTLSFFFRVWLLSIFLGQDVWNYLTNRIADFLEWGLTLLVNWGLLGIDMLGRPDLTIVQLLTLGAVILSDLVYLFTVHLTAWILLAKLGTPIPEPPEWVQALIEEEA